LDDLGTRAIIPTADCTEPATSFQRYLMFALNLWATKMARRKGPRRKRGKGTLIDKGIGEIKDALEALRHALDSYLPTGGRAKAARRTARRGPRVAKTARRRMAATRPRTRRRSAAKR